MVHRPWLVVRVSCFGEYGVLRVGSLLDGRQLDGVGGLVAVGIASLDAELVSLSLSADSDSVRA